LLSLAAIRAAACVAHRAPLEDVRRRTAVRATFLDLARASGWNDVKTLREVANVGPLAVWRREKLGHTAPSAAWLCLGDARLVAPHLPAQRAIHISAG
jgi:hypothetical protein